MYEDQLFESDEESTVESMEGIRETSAEFQKKLMTAVQLRSNDGCLEARRQLRKWIEEEANETKKQKHLLQDSEKDKQVIQKALKAKNLEVQDQKYWTQLAELDLAWKRQQLSLAQKELKNAKQSREQERENTSRIAKVERDRAIHMAKLKETKDNKERDDAITEANLKTRDAIEENKELQNKLDQAISELAKVNDQLTKARQIRKSGINKW